MDAETSKRRLTALVERLLAVPPERFCYGHWAGQDWKGAADLSCGTTACALGWGTTVPELANAGLCLRRDTCNRVYVSIAGDESFKGDAGFFGTSISAAQHVFGLARDEANFLFLPGEAAPSWMGGDDSDLLSPDADASAADVADHIERFVKAKFG